MELTALGYIGVRSKRLEEWESYATELLGMQRADCGAGVRAFRMDDRRQRLVVTDDGPEGLAFLGWEVADAAALDRLAARWKHTARRCAMASAGWRMSGT